MISRQKLIGWILIVVSAAFILYFLRTRLLVPGPIIEKKEWVNFVGSVICLFLGTINVRMAAMRERRRRGTVRINELVYAFDSRRNTNSAHSRASGNPASCMLARRDWVPAFAGTSGAVRMPSEPCGR